MQSVYRGILLGYPAGTTNMEELEHQGHERSIPMAGVSFSPAASLNNIHLYNAPNRLLWALSAPFLGVYVIVQNLNVPLILQPQLFCTFALVSWGQVRNVLAPN